LRVLGHGRFEAKNATNLLQKKAPCLTRGGTLAGSASKTRKRRSRLVASVPPRVKQGAFERRPTTSQAAAAGDAWSVECSTRRPESAASAGCIQFAASVRGVLFPQTKYTLAGAARDQRGQRGSDPLGRALGARSARRRGSLPLCPRPRQRPAPRPATRDSGRSLAGNRQKPGPA